MLGIPYYTLEDWQQKHKRASADPREPGIYELRKEKTAFSERTRYRRRQWFLQKPKEVKTLRYAFAGERADKWPVKAFCRMLKVSESGYYRYRKGEDKPSRDELF